MEMDWSIFMGHLSILVCFISYIKYTYIPESIKSVIVERDFKMR